MRLPSAFLPEEDQGIMLTQVQLPVGSTQGQTIEVLKKMENYFLEEEQSAVESIFTVAGFSFAGRGQNSGIAFVRLRDWSERDLSTDGVQHVVQRAMGYFSTIREAVVFALNPPSIPALGTSDGFNFQLQDQAGLGHEALSEARDQLLGAANQHPALAGVRHERPGGYAPVQAQRGPRGSAGDGHLAVADQQHPGGGLGLQLRQRLRRPGPRETGLCAGRRALPHAARGHRRLVRAQRHRRNGAVLGLRQRRVDLRLAAAGALQRPVVDEHPGQRGVRLQYR